ncbi:MAG: lactate utilization protein [Deltaproteobacteria bacterium]|nr:lactate utilization protein [Deltaproteobacteria bacterium]
MGHPESAALFLRDTERVHWHDQAIWFLRQKRDAAARTVPDWEALRERAEAIKAHALSRLGDYLEEFERNAVAHGAVVHWARDGEEHNRIVHGLLAERGVTRLVKSKSMLTEECGLNPYLEARGIEIADTDLGERIVQLNHQPPSHIVAPAIHMRREEVGALFHATLGSPEGLTDPTRLTEVARKDLRRHFLGAQAGLTGVNFGIAETGGVVVVTNEGNADMGTSLPPLHIASMGIEKVIPRAADLGVFLRLLARSAVGQPSSIYTSHFHGPRRGGELHIVVVDNGRSQLLGQPAHRRALACIRCGQCLNTCPVYRRSGGYSYTWLIPGPIGSVLAPARDPVSHRSLPFASTLCGSCTDVCPVRIDLHHQLYAWRGELARKGLIDPGKRLAMRLTSLVFRFTWLYALAGRLARLAQRLLPARFLARLSGGWTRQRELPVPPRESFRELYRRTRGRP